MMYSNEIFSFHTLPTLTQLTRLLLVMDVPGYIHQQNEVHWYDSFKNFPKLKHLTFKYDIDDFKFWNSFMSTIPRSCATRQSTSSTSSSSSSSTTPSLLPPRLYLHNDAIDADDSKYMYLLQFGVLHVPHPSLHFSHNANVDPTIKLAHDDYFHKQTPSHNISQSFDNKI